ncbi:hypothetical protein C8J56DRAFT_1056399 [Mycena floridula]|nr:hypothetical protein C8J56DRAFT_1056399 [Mycena floridula]
MKQDAMVWEESELNILRDKERYNRTKNAALTEYNQALAEWNHHPQGPKPQPPEPSEDFFPLSHKSLQRAETLLKEYLLEYISLYGTSALKPNHHWAVHVPTQIRDYGPVYNFWAFLTEHLNKVLKNMNSNNHLGGELEISMMREFSRASRMDAKLC